jgi:hypothetical protein
MLWTLAEHFGQICMMAVLIVGTQAFTRRAHAGRLRGEAQRVRCALIISLQALRKRYEENLGVLGGSRLPVIAGRNQINLLRVQFSRLMCLDQAEIEALWTASVAAEDAETAMAVVGKPVGGAAFVVPEQDDKKEMLQSALMRACARLETAEGLMAPTAVRPDERGSEDGTVIQFATHALRRKRRTSPGAPVRGRSSNSALYS